MRLSQILCESEDYSFHNMVAVARNQLDDYERRINVAANKHQLMPSEIATMEHGISNIRGLLDSLSDPENDYFNRNPAKREKSFAWSTQNLPEYERLLSQLPDAAKAATFIAKAIAIWLSFIHDRVNMHRYLAADPKDKAIRSAIVDQLRHANALARTGHPFQALFAGLKARTMMKDRQERKGDE